MKAGDLVEVKQDMDKANAGTLGVLLDAPGMDGDMDYPTLYCVLENMHSTYNDPGTIIQFGDSHVVDKCRPGQHQEFAQICFE